MSEPMTPEQADGYLVAMDEQNAMVAPWVVESALRTIAAMREEWGVRYEERHTTKYQPPSKMAGQPWSGDKWVRCDPYWKPHSTDWCDRDEAERRLRIYSKDRGYPRYRNARLVRRYVTEPQEVPR